VSIDEDIILTLALKVVGATFGKGRQAGQEVLDDIRRRYGPTVHASVIARLNKPSSSKK
jgi:hypothetical protein